MSLRKWILGLVLCTAAAPGFAQAAVTEDSFQLRTTQDLVDLCSASSTDSMGTAAINFCHGFGLGVYRVLVEVDQARKSGRFFCTPNPQPSRNEAVASFLQWAKANPTRLSLQPQDGLLAFLAKTYPCARGK